MIAYMLVAICAVGVVLLAAKYTKGAEDADPGGPTTGHAGPMISALFLIAFAIAIIVPWTSADSASANTYAESQAIAETYWSAGELPAAVGPKVRADLIAYVKQVQGPEWKQMIDDGTLTSEAWTSLENIRREVIAEVPKTDDERAVRSAVLDRVREDAAGRFQSRRHGAMGRCQSRRRGAMGARALLVIIGAALVVPLGAPEAEAGPGITICVVVGVDVLVGLHLGNDPDWGSCHKPARVAPKPAVPPVTPVVPPKVKPPAQPAAVPAAPTKPAPAPGAPALPHPAVAAPAA